MSNENALSLYDAFEFVIENFMKNITDLSVYLGATDEHIVMRLVLEGERNFDIIENPYADMTAKEEDGSLFLRLRLSREARS